MNDNIILEDLIPGKSDPVKKVRFQIASFSRNPSAKGVLLLGPIGSGKSTVARVIALMRYIHFLNNEKRQQIIENLKYDGPFRIDKLLLDFYEEINLTGLVSTLAHAQLFGVAKQAATNVSERAGIFEQAMYGHSSQDKKTDAAEITGGVVFLDEIGDLPSEHQPLLLSLLTETEVFRVGGEGNKKYGYTFKGTVIAGTWKSPFEEPFKGLLRPDLLSRLSAYIIQLPSLNERQDDFDEIVDAISRDIRKRYLSYLDDILKRSPYISKSSIDAEYGRELKVNKHSLKILKNIDWSVYGDLRGLRQILERSFYDNTAVAEAIEQSRQIISIQSFPEINYAEIMLKRLINNDQPITLADDIRKIEKQNRVNFFNLVRTSPELFKKLLQKTDVQKKDLMRQLIDLTRDRARKRNANQ